MEITNELISDSFSYQYSNEALTCRNDEQEKLDQVLDFCKSIEEMVCYAQELLDTEVEEGIFLYEIIYGLKNGKSRDGTVFLQEMFHKKCRVKTVESDHVIQCSCGTYTGGVATIQEYAKKRQEFLREMSDCREYGQFMRTCFPNSVFSDDCEQELTHIKNFKYYKEEITDCLSLLDEQAVPLYFKYQKNLVQAEKILQTQLKRTCAPDPDHKKDLMFEFSYEQEKNGEIQEKKKWVECQPHFKLVGDNSNLRVYFWWKDDEIGNGKKVLIGRVGRHPWKKR